MQVLYDLMRGAPFVFETTGSHAHSSAYISHEDDRTRYITIAVPKNGATALTALWKKLPDSAPKPSA
jgi:hypothetical protein